MDDWNRRNALPDLLGRDGICILGHEMKVLLYPLRDIQQSSPVAICARCGGEIYEEFAVMPGELCQECWEEESEEREQYGPHNKAACLGS